MGMRIARKDDSGGPWFACKVEIPTVQLFIDY